MKPFPRTSAFLSAALLLSAVPGICAASSLPGWYTDFDQALAVARREGKPLLADIGSENCPACRMLESQTLTHPEVQQRLDNFVKVQVDGNASPHILQQFGVTGYPTVVAIDPRGRIVDKSVGFVPAARFAGTLDNALAKAGPARRSRTEEAPEEKQLARQSEETETVPSSEGAGKEPSLPSGKKERVEVAAAARSGNGVTAEAASPKGALKPASRTAGTDTFNFYNMGATEAKVEKKVVAQAATPARTGDAALSVNVPASSVQVPERLLNLSPTGASAKTEKPTAERKTETASKAPGSASTSLATIKKLQGAGSTASAGGTDSEAEDEDASENSASSGDTAGATEADIRRWMSDADDHLKAGRKRQARAMYGKVVENDKANKYGRSDLAFIQHVMLSVDTDDDALRRQALVDIRKFKKLFPNSTRKDHYAVMHAILAADVGETDEAHGLLDTFRQDFPNSRFTDLAHQTWKGLPPVKGSAKKSSDTAKKSSDSSKKSSDSADSGSSRKPESSTKKSTSGNSTVSKLSTSRSSKPTAASSKNSSSRTTADAKPKSSSTRSSSSSEEE